MLNNTPPLVQKTLLIILIFFHVFLARSLTIFIFLTSVFFLEWIKLFQLFGPRHTTNPSHLRKFWVQKVTHKKLLNFSEKIHRYFKTILHLCPKHLRRNYPWKIRPNFDLKELEIFWFQKTCIFWSFFDIFKFYLQ